MTPQRRLPPRSRRIAGMAWWLSLLLSTAATGVQAATEPDAVERLERDSRAKPEAIADELEKLLASSPIEGVARLDAEHLLGMLRANLHQPSAAETVAQALVKQGAPAYSKLSAEQLNAAAVCIRVEVALSNGGSL